MNIRSQWPAAGVVLVTLLVCFFGVRAELTLAHQSEVQRGPLLAAPTAADRLSQWRNRSSPIFI
jgi:hypothetical protein